MKVTCNLLTASVVLAAMMNGLSQPTISNFQLSGQPQTPQDTTHLYSAFSVSPGADVTFRCTVGSPGPFGYQWRFNQNDLPGQTNINLRFPSVQITNAGDYTLVVTNLGGSATSQVATLTVDSTFTKITSGAIVTDAGYSSGGTWGDFDNDGFPDLFVFNYTSGNAQDPFLYRNNDDGTFTKVTSGPPVIYPAQSSSSCWGDYDNDGNLDLYVATSTRNFLFHNAGNGSFTRVTTGNPVTDYANTTGAAWADYDRDGFLDLFTTPFDPAASSHCSLYHNNGEGTFTSVTNNVLATELASSVGCAWADFDNDGWPDVFVAGGRAPGSPLAPNRLYHNNGDGTFTKITSGSIATDVGYTGACAWGDYDNDGWLDLFVANIGGLKNFLYHNNGDGTFTRITNDIVANDISSNSQSCAWGDYDNDGFLDLFVATTGNSLSDPTVNLLYHNNGDGTFTKITTGSPVNERSDGGGCAWVDYDNDGFLDLFATRADGQGNYLYHNNGNTNSWLTVNLVGTLSNRAAIGAKVRVKAFYRGTSHWQLRQITGGSGWNGHNELQANFGLGDATNVDTVRIEWPSGVVQTLTNVAPKQLLNVVEHQEPGSPAAPELTGISVSTNGALNLSATGRANLQYLLEGSTNLVNWTKLGVRTNLTGIVLFTDPKGASLSRRFYRVLVP